MATILQLPLSTQEARSLLRLIATANDALARDPTSVAIQRQDAQTGSWLADRILRLVEAEKAKA